MPCSEYMYHFQAESSCDSSSEGCDSDGNSSGQDSHGTGVIDLEELGAFSSSFRAAREKEVEENSPREMVTAALRDSLTRQGYRIVGTHSGVKLCRWTKVVPKFLAVSLLYRHVTCKEKGFIFASCYTKIEKV